MIELKVTSLLPTRLDKYLMQEFPALGLGRLNKALRENKIKLNGKKQPLSTRVLNGDKISLYLKDEQLGLAEADGPLYLQARCPAEIVYQDENLMIVNKPAGLMVEQEGEADTLMTRVQLALHKEGTLSKCSPRLCHRLDTGTSGLVMVAKNAKAEAYFTELIRQRAIKKKYLCVTFGRPQPEAATLNGWLYKDAEKGLVFVQRKKSPGAKEVITRYETEAFSGRLALLKVELITGRTHQIRAHLASIGCPILGDSKYGNNAANRELRCKYQALCAWELTLPEIKDPTYANLSHKVFRAPKPWYYAQILDGTLK